MRDAHQVTGNKSYQSTESSTQPRRFLTTTLENSTPDLGDHQKAIEMLTKSLEIEISVYGEQHSATAISYNNLGQLYSKLRRPSKSHGDAHQVTRNKTVCLRRAALSHGGFLQQPRTTLLQARRPPESHGDAHQVT